MKVIALVTVVLITGCAAHYRPPVDAPTATLLFETNKRELRGSAPLVGLWLVDTAKCPGAVEKRGILTDIDTNHRPARLSIEAGKPFVFRVQMVNLIGGEAPPRCNVAGAFVPVAGQTYLLEHSINPGGCGFEVSVVSISQSLGRQKWAVPSTQFFGGIEENQICRLLKS